MKKRIKKAEAGENIEILLEKAKNYSSKEPLLAREYVKKAKRLAMHFNIKLPREIRKKFCGKCFTFFTHSNVSIRLKRGFLVLKCLNCNNSRKYKII